MMRPRLAPWMTARTTGLTLAALVVLALLVRLTFFTGFVASDDSAYLGAASQMLTRLDWSGQDLASSRIGFVAAVAAGLGVFGTRELGIVAIPLLASLATHVIVYRLATLYYGRSAALLAVGLLAVYPLNVVLSTVLVPETLLSCLMAGALLAYELADRAGRGRGLAGALSAGVLLGLAYLVKEPAALVLVAFALVWAATAVTRRHLRLAWIALPVGFALVFALAALVEYQISGELFRRAQVIAQTQARAAEVEHALHPWYLYPRSMFISAYSVGPLFYLLAGGLIWACVRRLRLPVLPVAWLLVVLGYLTFGSASLTSYVPLPKQPRYLEAITVPAILLAAPALHDFLVVVSARKRWYAVTAVTVYTVSALLCAQLTSAMERWRFQPARTAYDFVARAGLHPAYASPLLASGLFQLSGATWDVRDVRSHVCGDAGDRSLVLMVTADAADTRALPPSLDCQGWRSARELQVEPPAFLAGSLPVVRALLGHAPIPASLTAKILRTIDRDETPKSVRLLVPVTSTLGRSAGTREGAR
jgi:4-amino-4-deoxy-L-arabinose transferase-like glycosyltransferase